MHSGPLVPVTQTHTHERARAHTEWGSLRMHRPTCKLSFRARTPMRSSRAAPPPQSLYTCMHTHTVCAHTFKCAVGIVHTHEHTLRTRALTHQLTHAHNKPLVVPGIPWHAHTLRHGSNTHTGTQRGPIETHTHTQTASPSGSLSHTRSKQINKMQETSSGILYLNVRTSHHMIRPV